MYDTWFESTTGAQIKSFLILLKPKCEFHVVQTLCVWTAASSWWVNLTKGQCQQFKLSLFAPHASNAFKVKTYTFLCQVHKLKCLTGPGKQLQMSGKSWGRVWRTGGLVSIQGQTPSRAPADWCQVGMWGCFAMFSNFQENQKSRFLHEIPPLFLNVISLKAQQNTFASQF